MEENLKRWMLVLVCPGGRLSWWKSVLEMRGRRTPGSEVEPESLELPGRRRRERPETSEEDRDEDAEDRG